jgi:hypothetical protein
MVHPSRAGMAGRSRVSQLDCGCGHDPAPLTISDRAMPCARGGGGGPVAVRATGLGEIALVAPRLAAPAFGAKLAVKVQMNRPRRKAQDGLGGSGATRGTPGGLGGRPEPS